MNGWRVSATWLIGAVFLVAGHDPLAIAQQPAAPPSTGLPPAALPAAVAPADVPPADVPSTPKFRRVYAPFEQIQKGTWTQGYLPIDAEQFERFMATVNAAALGAPGAEPAQIDSGEYTAQLVGEDLLVGSGNIQLSRLSDTPGMLPMEPCSLALGAAAWQDQNSKSALLGTGPDGRLAVLVEGARLHCDWSLRGQRTASGSVSFHLELPGCPMSRLSLDMPSGLEVIADQGIALKAAGALPQTSRWTFELGGHNRLSLRIISEGTGFARRPLTLLRQSLTYGFSPRGINVEAQLKLDIHGEPLQRIAVDLDPSLRLVAARYGELQVPWSATANVETRMSHVVLQLPEPIVGTGRVLQLSALAPLSADSHWRLPSLQPQGMSWQEGTATLLIPNPLVLDQLTLEGCRQSRTTALPAPASGESIEIQYYRPGASIVAFLTQPREQLKVGSGTQVEVGANEITSRSIVELTLARGERREILCDVNNGWTIDGVESLGPIQVAEWGLEDQPSQPTQLRIRLNTAVSAANPARLSLRGHRPLPSASPFEARQLEMLGFDGWQRGVRLISVHGADGFELSLPGLTDLNRIDPLKLSPAELQLFGQPPGGLLFSEDAAFAQTSVTLARRKPSYTADIRVDAVVQKQVLTETYTIQCTPEAARLERLLVRMSQTRDVPLEWNLAGGNSGQFSRARSRPANRLKWACRQVVKRGRSACAWRDPARSNCARCARRHCEGKPTWRWLRSPRPLRNAER